MDRMKWPLKPTPERSRWLKDGRMRVQSGWKALTDADEAIDEEEYQRHVAEFFGDRSVTREQLWAWLQAPHSWFVSEKADAQKVIKRGSEMLSGSAFSRWCDDCLQMVQVLDEVSKNLREHVVIHATMRGENLLMTKRSSTKKIGPDHWDIHGGTVELLKDSSGAAIVVEGEWQREEIYSASVMNMILCRPCCSLADLSWSCLSRPQSLLAFES